MDLTVTGSVQIATQLAEVRARRALIDGTARRALIDGTAESVPALPTPVETGEQAA